MRKGSLNIRLIQHAIENGYLTQLAVFIKLKSIFSNSCYSSWSYRSVSAKSGISVTTLRKCIPFFLERGWCRVHCGNLVFNKISEVDCTKWDNYRIVLRIEILESESYRDLIKRIRILLIESKNKSFQYVKKVCHDYNNPTNLPSFKKAKKLVEKGWIERQVSCSDNFTMSNRSIGNLFGRSYSTASRLQKFGAEKGIFKVTTRMEEVSIDRAKHCPVISSMPGLFFHHGSAFVQKSNLILF